MVSLRGFKSLDAAREEAAEGLTSTDRRLEALEAFKKAIIRGPGKQKPAANANADADATDSGPPGADAPEDESDSESASAPKSTVRRTVEIRPDGTRIETVTTIERSASSTSQGGVTSLHETGDGSLDSSSRGDSGSEPGKQAAGAPDQTASPDEEQGKAGHRAEKKGDGKDGKDGKPPSSSSYGRWTRPDW